MFDPVHLLMVSASAQMTFVCLLGWVMLVPRQFGTAAGALRALSKRDFTAAHVDWVLLALAQLGAALLLTQHPIPHARWVAAALVFGGWLNPVPYVLRAFGVNAFRFGGDRWQRLSAALAGTSSLALTGAWLTLFVEVWS